MPTLTHGEASIHYEVQGAGYPVLMFAPGGMYSSIPLWERSPLSPVQELSSEFLVITMDQRNAGRSRAPVQASDGWRTYTGDHVALLDELGIERCHVLGMCIGAAFCSSLIAKAPERVSAAVLKQPIGLHGTNRDAFHGIFDPWAAELLRTRPELTPEAFAGLRQNLYGGDFVFSVSRDEVRACPAPLLVLRGNDVYHPSDISEEIARIAPRAELIPSWKEGDAVAAAKARVKDFLRAHATS